MECSLMPASAAFEFHGRRLGGYQLYTARCTGSSTESRAEITQRAISYRMDCATAPDCRAAAEVRVDYLSHSLTARFSESLKPRVWFSAAIGT